MEAISKFTVESQIQHYASLTFTPQVDADLKEHYLTMDALPHFINAAEWSLGNHAEALRRNLLLWAENVDVYANLLLGRLDNVR